MPPASELWYVYGITPASIDVRRAPDGLDDAPLELCVDGDLAAVASRLDGERYSASEIERGTENVEWLVPRAVAHDRILTWLSDHGPVVPLPIFSLFSAEEAVRRTLRERRAELQSALRRVERGREYALRVYRIDAELATVAAEYSPRLAELERSAAAANPGQRYLLERKLDAERKKELHGIGANIARQIAAALRPFPLETVETRVSGQTVRPDAEGTLILDIAFLVDPGRLEDFQRALTEIVAQHGGRGFRFDFTGPWPPYHFAKPSDEP
jgi:hypothetical protein